MEQKLFYQDAYLKNFAAELIREETDEAGRVYAVLSQTGFYPAGGGQPSDTGTLNGIPVLDVEEVGGEIRHYLSASLNAPIQVSGHIQWERRFDHMQQHAGQHILSAAFERLFEYKTVSFHLGVETLTIDLDTENLSKEQAAAAEKLANEIILENRPILSKWVDSQELQQYQLRKELSVSENIRLVIIPDFDYNGCGGTHPASTGQVSALKIVGWEREKKKIRVQFVCGDRVRRLLEQKHLILSQLTSLMNAPESEMVNAVKSLLEKRKDLEKQVAEAEEQLLSYEAKEILQANTGMVITALFKERSVQELQKLARILVTNADDKISLLVTENGEKLQFVCAKGGDAEGNMKVLAAFALHLINGKGGGNEAFAQGGGEKLLPGKQFLQLLVDHVH